VETALSPALCADCKPPLSFVSGHEWTSVSQLMWVINRWTAGYCELRNLGDFSAVSHGISRTSPQNLAKFPQKTVDPVYYYYCWDIQQDCLLPNSRRVLPCQTSVYMISIRLLRTLSVHVYWQNSKVVYNLSAKLESTGWKTSWLQHWTNMKGTMDLVGSACNSCNSWSQL